jgi:hypothetical protein
VVQGAGWKKAGEEGGLMADSKHLQCPKCAAEGRKKCTRFHYVQIGDKTYIRCEQKTCGWKAGLK